MGNRLLVASIAVFAIAMAAQQPPAPKSAAPTPSTTAANRAAQASDLPAEPVTATAAKSPATLRDAAQAHDFAAFETLYQNALKNGENVGAFADLHDVWSFAENNTSGAFYGRDIHDRLAARYPDYAKYIEPYQVKDRNGNPFFPSVETRAFLLAQAVEGNDPVVASRGSSTAVAATAPVGPRSAATAAPSFHNGPARSSAARTTPAAAATTERAIEPPESIPSDALASDMAKAAGPTASQKFVQAEMVDTAGTTQGIFMIILGLIGIGVLTMTMQASSSDVHVTDDDDLHAPSFTIAAANEAAHPQPTNTQGSGAS